MPSFLEKDRIVLAALDDYRRRFEQRRERVEFARILDIGKNSSVDFASAMKRLVVLGLAERRQRSDTGNYSSVRSRASYEYRITTEGVSRLADHHPGETK